MCVCGYIYTYRNSSVRSYSVYKKQSLKQGPVCNRGRACFISSAIQPGIVRYRPYQNVKFASSVRVYSRVQRIISSVSIKTSDNANATRLIKNQPRENRLRDEGGEERETRERSARDR